MLNQAGSGGFPDSNKVAIFVYFIFKVQLALCSQVSNPDSTSCGLKIFGKKSQKVPKAKLEFSTF